MNKLEGRSLYTDGNTTVILYTECKHVLTREELVIIGNPDNGELFAIPKDKFTIKFKRIMVNIKQ